MKGYSGLNLQLFQRRHARLALAMLWTLLALNPGQAAEVGKKVAFQLTSSAFEDGKAIPSTYTCDGRDVSPSLAWTGAPTGMKSFALIADDPDAPMGRWVHWVLYNLPPTTTGLPEAYATDAQMADGTLQGTTDFGRTGYGGPCPPSGTHRYFFTLYALDTVFPVPARVTARQLEDAMRGHILAETRLMGTYRRKGR